MDLESDNSGRMNSPLWAIILFLMGSGFLRIGMAAYLADVHILPEMFQEEGYGLKMIIVGGILNIPDLVFKLRNLRKSAKLGPREI